MQQIQLDDKKGDYLKKPKLPVITLSLNKGYVAIAPLIYCKLRFVVMSKGCS
jgi:hypothetical protein